MSEKKALLNLFLEIFKMASPGGAITSATAVSMGRGTPIETAAVETGMGLIGQTIQSYDQLLKGVATPTAATSLAPGIVQQSALSSGVSPQVASQVGRAGASVVERERGAIEKAVTELPQGSLAPGAGPLVNAAYAAEVGFSHAVARPLSTTLLLTDPESPLYQGGRQIDVGGITKPSTPGIQWGDLLDAWNRSADVSFGKALVANPVAKNTIGLIGGAGKYDPWSDYDMEQAQNNPFYQLLTGTADFALEVVGPTKVARPARIAGMKRAGLSTTVAGPEDLIALRADYEMHRIHGAANEVKKQAATESASISLSPRKKVGLTPELTPTGSNAPIINSFLRDAENAKLSLNDPRGNSYLANEVYQWRARDLLNNVQNAKVSYKDNGSLFIDFSDDATYRSYMARYYPEITDDTVVTLYRGLRSGEDPFVSPGMGSGSGAFTPGYSSYWTFNPAVASAFAEGSARGGKVASIDVRFGDLPALSGNKRVPPGPSDNVYGYEDAITLDYTTIPDQIKSSVKVLDPVDTAGATNVYDGWVKSNATISQSETIGRNVGPGQQEVLAPEKLAAAEEASLRAQQTPIGRMVEKLAKETRQGEIRTNPLVANSEGADKGTLSKIISETNDPDTVFEILMANLGDQIALRNLINAAPDSVWALGEMNAAVRNSWIDGAPFRPQGEQLTRVNQVFDSALARDEYFDQLKRAFTTTVDEVDGLMPRSGSFWMPTKSLLIEKIRGAGRSAQYRVRTGDYDDAPKWISETFNSGAGRPATVFLQWASSRQPLGIVTRSGPRVNDMYIELDAMVDSIPIFRGTRRVTVGQDLVDGKMVPITVSMKEYREGMMRRLTEAQQKGNIQEAWQSIEDELVDVMSDTVGIDRAISREFTRGYRVRAQEDLSYMQNNGGYLYDELGQRILIHPQTRRQMLDSFATLPMDDIYLAMRTELSNLSKAGITSQQLLTSAFDEGLKFFRVNLLFRAGYLTKFSITEPAIMSALSHGTILADDGLMATLGRFGRNRAKNVKRVAYTLELDTMVKKHVLRQPVQTRAKMQAELDDLVRQRHDAERVMDDLIAELDDMKSGRVSPYRVAQYQDEVQGRLVDAQVRLNAIQDQLDGKMPQWRQVVEPANLTDVRASLRKYDYMLGENPGYINEIRTQIKGIEDRAARNNGVMNVNDKSKYDILMRELEELESFDPSRLTPEARAAIAKLKEDYDEAIQFYKEPVNDPALRIQELEQKIKVIDSQIGRTQVELGASREKLAEVTGMRGFEGSGQDYMTVNIGGDSFQVPAAFSDRAYDFGSGYRAEASAAMTSRLTFDPSYRMAQKSSQWRRSGEPMVIAPDNPVYWDELAHVANQQLRGDLLFQKIFEGQSRAEIGKWLASPEGVAYQKSMKTKYLVPNEKYSDPVRPLPDIDAPTGAGQPPSTWQKATRPRARRVILESTTELDEKIRLVNQYFPDEKVRQLIATREVTPGELQRLMGGRDDLSRILGEDLIYAPRNQAVAVLDATNRALDRIWSWIATLPEDRFGRWPWYQREFRSVMEQRGNILAGQGVKMDSKMFAAFRQESHRTALGRLEKTFYNIRRYNTPIYALRMLMAFPGATFNAFYRYGRMAVREPERTLVAALMFNSILEKYGLDEEGNPVDDVRKVKNLLIPGTRKDEMDNGLQVPLESLLTVAFDWPSAAYTVSIGLAQVNRMNPKTEDVAKRILGEAGFEAVFPYGFPRNPASGFFGAYQKDLWRALQGESDADFLQAAVQFHANNMAEWEKNGMEGEGPSFTDAVRDARAFYFSRAGWKFVETFAVNRQPPGQMMRQAWYKIREQYPGDPLAARAQYMKEYGDWARWYTYSSSDYRTYIPSSVEGFERIWEDDPELTRKIVSMFPDDPSIVGIMSLGASEEFSQPVMNYMRETPLPGDNVPVIRKMTVEKFDNMVQVNDGWALYNNGKVLYDAERLRLREMRDDASTEAEADMYRSQLTQLEDSWKTWVDEYSEENKAWGVERLKGYGDRSKRAALVLREVLKSKKFTQRRGFDTVWSKVEDFLNERDKALNAMQIAKGDRKLSGKQRDEYRAIIKRAFADYVEENYLENDPSFSGLWNRYFSGEWVEE